MTPNRAGKDSPILGGWATRAIPIGMTGNSTQMAHQHQPSARKGRLGSRGFGATGVISVKPRRGVATRARGSRVGFVHTGVWRLVRSGWLERHHREQDLRVMMT